MQPNQVSTNRVLCTYARRGGPKKHICIVHIGEEHENFGESAICNLEPAQEWIKDLEPGDAIYVTNRIRRSDLTDQLITDASPNAFQPLYNKQKKQITIQPELPAPKLEIVPNPPEPVPTLRRIDTYLEDPQDINVLVNLAEHCSLKHAAHLLLRHSIRCLPRGAKNMSGDQLYDLLTK